MPHLMIFRWRTVFCGISGKQNIVKWNAPLDDFRWRIMFCGIFAKEDIIKWDTLLSTLLPIPSPFYILSKNAFCESFWGASLNVPPYAPTQIQCETFGKDSSASTLTFLDFWGILFAGRWSMAWAS